MNLRRIAAGVAALGLPRADGGRGLRHRDRHRGSRGHEDEDRDPRDAGRRRDGDGRRDLRQHRRPAHGDGDGQQDARTCAVARSSTSAWSGAGPSAGIAGETEKLGHLPEDRVPGGRAPVPRIDDSTGQDLSPTTCWTTSFNPRADGRPRPRWGTRATCTYLYASEKERAVSVPSEQEWATTARVGRRRAAGTHAGRRIPFVSADSKGTTYWSCTPADIAPEMSTSRCLLPPNERVELDRHLDGTGFTGLRGAQRGGEPVVRAARRRSPARSSSSRSWASAARDAAGRRRAGQRRPRRARLALPDGPGSDPRGRRAFGVGVELAQPDQHPADLRCRRRTCAP